jgi:hypothetical protein
MTGCDYNFKALNGNTSTAQVHLLCPTEAGVDIGITSAEVLHPCFKITPFTSTGIGYHDAELPKGQKKNIVTATANVAVPAGVVMVEGAADAVCKAATGNLATVTSATYTTGNTLVTGEKEGVMAEAWFE